MFKQPIFYILCFLCFVIRLLTLSGAWAQQSFYTEQLKFSRVRDAQKNTETALKKTFTALSLPFPPKGIFLRVFKTENIIEVWVKNTKNTFELLKTYPICYASGEVGPKRREGDGQVPEGLYQISLFNPSSNFHLSLKVSYPNESDRILGAKGNLGGDIFIHGNCVSIGCLAIEKYIEELYWLSVLVKTNGGTLPVFIFPAKFDSNNYIKIVNEHQNNALLLAFWENLRTFSDYFDKNKQLPTYTIEPKTGKYLLR